MLRDDLYNDMIRARKEGEKEKLSAFILIWNEITNLEKLKNREATDEEFVSIVKKAIKQDSETLAAFKLRNDQVKIAMLEGRIGIYEAYLPEELDNNELSEIIKAATAGKTMRDMGSIMNEIKARVAGKADMKKVSVLVKTTLT